jgi:hypothetical protein
VQGGLQQSISQRQTADRTTVRRLMDRASMRACRASNADVMVFHGPQGPENSQ